MISLTEKYRPRTLEAFAGLAQIKAVFGRLKADPWESAWLLTGDSGTGKTSIALSLVAEMGAELHHIKSGACTVDVVGEVCASCRFTPFFGGWHVVICDEADKMSNAAQVSFLSRLDGSDWPPMTIFLFTCNSTKLLEKRFLSRCKVLTVDGMKDIAAGARFLESVWAKESGLPCPNMMDLLEKNEGNIRGALNDLELELIAPGSIADVLPVPSISVKVSCADRVPTLPARRGSSTHHVPDGLRDQALRLKAQGFPLGKIASQIGAPQSSVWRWVH